MYLMSRSVCEFHEWSTFPNISATITLIIHTYVYCSLVRQPLFPLLHNLGHFGTPAESLCVVCASLEGALPAVSKAVWRGIVC